MRSNYKRIGDYIQLVDERNKDLRVTTLLGLTIDKKFIPSVANTVGSNMKKYKIIRKNQFSCSLMQVRRDKKIPVAILKDFDVAIISQAYPVFEIIDTSELLPDYLMMWMSRPEFDREACFYAVGGVRGSMEWEDFCNMQLPVPSINKQKAIVEEYNTVANRIKLNEQLNQKLEETAQAIYKHWFVDFEFPMTKEYAESIGKPELEGKPYKSNGGEMVWNEELEQKIPKDWELNNLIDIAEIYMGQSPSGESYNLKEVGEIFYQGSSDFGFRHPNPKYYTTEPKKMAKKGDVLMSVRAPVGDLNITNYDCCIGRGIACLRSKKKCNSYLFYLLKEVRNRFNSTNDVGTVFGSITRDGLYEISVLKPHDNLIYFFEDVVKRIDINIKNKCIQGNTLNQFKEIVLSKMTKVEIEKALV